MNLCCYTIWN